MSALNPEPRTLNPLLPPTLRDFEIHRLSSIELLSTRKIAGQFKISQTRVRQIVEEVSHWLAEKIPFATDLELERYKRLALHLAAAQLRHQIEQLQELWADSKDTKFLRQQTRCILALARLGVIPGTLDALAADAEDRGIGVPPVQDQVSHSPPPPLSPSPIPNPKSEICNQQSQIPSPPPFEDCSPKLASHSITATTLQPVPAPTPSLSTPNDENFIPDDANLEELNLIEKHLLTTLDRTPSDKPKNRDVLNQALAELRHKRTCHTLQISPNIPGVKTVPTDPPILDQIPATQHA